MACLDRDGRVRVSHNGSEVGMGTHTMFSVVAAKTLGIPQSHVSVGKPDTDNELPFFGVNSQRREVRILDMAVAPEKILEALAALRPDVGKAGPKA